MPRFCLFIYSLFVVCPVYAEELLVQLDGRDDRACLITSTVDQYGSLSKSIFLNADSSSFKDLGEKIDNIRRRVRKMRRHIVKFDSAGHILRANRLRSKVNQFKSYRKELKRCRRQEDEFFVDFGEGLNPPICGVVTVDSNKLLRVINGKSCEDSNTSVVLLNLRSDSGDNFICSGTVIGDRHILTAAHCALGIIKVSTSIKGQSFSSKALFVHPEYDGTEEHDLSIVEFTENLPVQAQAIVGRYHKFSLGEKVFMAGYGRDNFDNTGRLLVANNVIDSFTTTSIFITFDNNSQGNSCNGDSGGPLYVYRNSRWEIAGVVSNGVRRDCGLGDLSGFVNIKARSNQNFIKTYVPNAIQ